MTELDQATFADRAGETFHVRLPDGPPLDLVLLTVTAPGEGAAERSFSLVFGGPPQLFLPQATYTFEHPEIGEVDIFIVPIAEAADGYRYEAVFTRLPEAP